MVKRATLIVTFLVLTQAGAAVAQGSLRGRVTAAGTGAAVAGAQVSLADLALGGITGPDGGYEVGGIPAGTHEVVVVLIGYQTERRQVTVVDGQPTTLNVAISETTLELEGLVAVGSRARPRIVTESPVPVDVIPTREIAQQGDTDFANLVRNVVPSFNVNIQPISDAATFVRPANLRGLAPDHTLVLINGKRRHRAAVITWYGNGLADGSQGPDIALIPGMALEQIEVLRDGASAQYGSDAIAGVMNMVLRNDRSGGLIELKTGGYPFGATSEPFEEGMFPGDGEMYNLSGNFGLPLGETGFLNLTGEYGNANPTDRSTQRNDALALLGAGNTSVRSPAQIWGSPQVSNEIKVWANMGYLFDETMQFYGHGNYVSKQVEGGFYYRNPGTRSGVFGTRNADGERVLLIGDMLAAADPDVPVGAAVCPEVRVTDDGVVIDTPDNRDAYTRVMNDPDCFTFQKLFPGGFTPQFGSYLLDASAVAGLRGASGNLDWDASAAWGKSNLDFYMYNTVNASLGPNQPCAGDDRTLSFVVPDQPCTPWFNPGVYDQQEVNLNVDLSYALNERVNLAGGAEWRNERFEIIRGSTESWTEGPLATQGFTPGSNGFTGFGPLTEGVWNRNNFAAYGDMEIREPAGAWTFGMAGRVERFSDFGTTINGKVAGRVSASESLGLRASVSTGFRAPTPGQQNAFNISTIYDPAIMDLTNNGTIPSTSPLAANFGGEALTPEKSVNLALGAVYDDGPFSLSMDFFRIRVSDRLTTSADRSLSPTEIEQLIAEGIIRPGGVLARFRFFINDFTTRTDGIDLVGAYDIEGAGGSTTTLSSAWNWTRTTVTDFNANTLTAHRIRILEEGLPGVRGNLAMNHSFASGTRFLVRASYWGGYFDGEQPYYESSPDNTIDYPARIIFDAEAGRPFADRWTLTVGAQNLLNTYPEEYPGAAAGVGNRFGQFTPFGFNGGYYYTRVGYSW